MTRHFSGKVTTIWALGAGDERESGGGQAPVTTALSQTGLVLRGGGGGALSGGAEGWPEPQLPQLRTRPPQDSASPSPAWEELTPWIPSQLRAGCARTRGWCSKSKINLQARREVNQVSCLHDHLGRELPADGSRGGGRPQLKAQRAQHGDREEAGKAETVRGGRDIQRQKQRQPFVGSP